MPIMSGPLALCEGRPNQPCPNRAAGSLSQGDLMLCSECEEFRFPSSNAKSKLKSKDKPGKPAIQVTSNRTRATAKRGTPASESATRDTKVSNDIELKLDSSRDTADVCPLCTTSVTLSDSLKCDVCNKSLHFTCAGLTNNTASILCSIIEETGWVCLPCRTDARMTIRLLQSGQAKLAEEVAVLRDEISEIRVSGKKESMSPDDNVDVLQSPDIATAVTFEVHRELSDITRRKRNVIISGLPECQIYNGKEISDEEAFCSLCEEHLTLKPSIARQGCRRLGKVHANPGKPRRLLVPLTTEENAKSLLSVAKKLRSSDDPVIASSVYINADLTPTQAKLAYDKRVQRRQRLAGEQLRRQPHANLPSQKDSSSQDGVSLSATEHLERDNGYNRNDSNRDITIPTGSVATACSTAPAPPVAGITDDQPFLKPA